MTPHEALREIAQIADISGKHLIDLPDLITKIHTLAAKSLAEPDDTVAVPRELLERAEDVAHANGHDDLAASLRALLGNKP
jgi:hypothetical protein